jgi:hypothetical protein
MRSIVLCMAVAMLVAPSSASAGEDEKRWYLMEPPVDETSSFGHGVLDQAPLSRWHRIATFSTEAACESKRKDEVEASRTETLRLSRTSPLSKLEIFKRAYRDSRLAGVSTCVASDDPQLTSPSTP